jgi:hypothetical protein
VIGEAGQKNVWSADKACSTQQEGGMPERWLFVAVKVDDDGEGESISALDEALMDMQEVLDFRVRRTVEELERSIPKQ